MIRYMHIVSILLILFYQMGCTPEAPMVLATYTYSSNDRVANLQPLAQELERVLNRPVRVKSYVDVESLLEGLQSNQVDAALINTLGYLLLARDNKHMLPIATLKITADAVDNYKTVLLTNSNNLTNLNDLKEGAHLLSMTFVKSGSTSGNLVPRLLLSSLGLKSPENQFDEVKYGGDHSTTFETLIHGKTDVCAIGSNEYFKRIRQDSSLLNICRTLWVSEEIPLGPVLINRQIAEEDKKKIKELILTLHQEKKEVLESIKDGWSEAQQTSRFYPIEDSYYDSFREINGNPTDLFNILEAIENK